MQVARAIKRVARVTVVSGLANLDFTERATGAAGNAAN